MFPFLPLPIVITTDPFFFFGGGGREGRFLVSAFERRFLDGQKKLRGGLLETDCSSEGVCFQGGHLVLRSLRAFATCPSD